MTDFSITFDTGNAAFDDGNGPAEAAQVLDRIATLLKDGHTDGPCHDSNGNLIGSWYADFPEQDDAS